MIFRITHVFVVVAIFNMQWSACCKIGELNSITAHGEKEHVYCGWTDSFVVDSFVVSGLLRSGKYEGEVRQAAPSFLGAYFSTISKSPTFVGVKNFEKYWKSKPEYMRLTVLNNNGEVLFDQLGIFGAHGNTCYGFVLGFDLRQNMRVMLDFYWKKSIFADILYIGKRSNSYSIEEDDLIFLVFKTEFQTKRLAVSKSRLSEVEYFRALFKYDHEGQKFIEIDMVSFKTFQVFYDYFNSEPWLIDNYIKNLSAFEIWELFEFARMIVYDRLKDSILQYVSESNDLDLLQMFCSKHVRFLAGEEKTTMARLLARLSELISQ